MITLTATAAKARFSELLDQVQREPVRVTRHHRLAGVVLSAQDYEAMRIFYAYRLQQSLDGAARSPGLTDEEASALLADES